ncbi:hypothetical protein EF847_16310 [Actinobacteria bacterium YIM 96077]|uniref:Oxidoreductase n=1 Tax=Phytoactinopolyspora halophila TaxID=1981511 RepID=A0A329QE69_9ACTN|nr:PmoA family protein [Phytoactinopolyspora halophila]AYY15589.1 hypothetical protein EF847_16310 [Actinobacteria bacterium YIM 96077]RAW10301.1 hypothetical protein DPM12_19140 [Phytoactinopolyspora halophila]
MTEPRVIDGGVTEPAREGLHLDHEHGRSLRIRYGERELTRYVYEPWDPQLESPRPYFHPVRTLRGDVVSLYRPHDHVWHKGIAWSVANVGAGRVADDPPQENFWGGTTFVRGTGYQQLENDGAMRHREFTRLDASREHVDVAHGLDWLTQDGRRWVDEVREFAITVGPVGIPAGESAADTTVGPAAWVLTFGTRMTNVSGHYLTFGSPTTQGRENAGYGGLFWRGPRSFTGGTVYAPGTSGGDELMGTRSPWLGLSGVHDEHGRASTLVFIDDPANAQHPTQWFVRSQMFACVCPAPFFNTEIEVAPDESIERRYAVVVADGDPGADGAEGLAKLGFDALASSDLGAF